MKHYTFLNTLHFWYLWIMFTSPSCDDPPTWFLSKLFAIFHSGGRRRLAGNIEFAVPHFLPNANTHKGEPPSGGGCILLGSLTWLFNHVEDRLATGILVVLKTYNTVILILVSTVHGIFPLVTYKKGAQKRKQTLKLPMLNLASCPTGSAFGLQQKSISCLLRSAMRIDAPACLA